MPSLAKAARAAATKALIFSMSLTPGALSTPEETSTPASPDSAIASPTLSASSPPDSSHGLRGWKSCGEPPVERHAVAAGQRRALRRLGVDQQRVGGMPCRRRRLREIRGLGDADRLDRGDAELALDRRRRVPGSPGRATADSPARSPRRSRRASSSLGVDAERDDFRARRARCGERARALRSVDVARALGEKHESDHVGARARAPALTVSAVESPQILIV